MRLENHIAIIAGAAWGGIGGATALRFAQEGARVVVNTLSREKELHETVSRIEAIGGQAVGVMGDASQEETWSKLVATALERYGKVTLLFYNPATNMRHPIADYPVEDWQRVMDVALTGALIAAQAVIPEMIRAGGGSLVFNSSIHSLATIPRYAAYATAKAGLNALVRSIALECGRDGIRANAVAPGAIMGQRQIAGLREMPGEEAAVIDLFPIGRYGRPEDIANVALFLASDEAAFVTGQTIVADGGNTLRLAEALVWPSRRLYWRDNVLVPQPPA